MNRTQEYWDLVRELSQLPPGLDGTAARARERAKRRRAGRRWGLSLGSLAGVCAAFGKVIEGMEVADAIVGADRDRADKPRRDQRMKSVTVETFGVDYPAPEKC